MGMKVRADSHLPLWRQSINRWPADRREAWEHLAAKLEYEAADFYPTREAAEKAAWEVLAVEVSR